jgi:uncharacterized membrane protein
MKDFFDLVNRGLIVVLVGAAIWAWPRLPDEIPTHFGLDGQADAWSPTTLFSWFLVPISALILMALIGWLRRLIPRKPRWVNLPDKTKLEDLPEVARRPVVEALSGLLAMVQTEVLVIFGLIQMGSYRAAHGQESQGLIILVLLIAILSSPVLLIVFFLTFQSAMEKAKPLSVESPR